MSKTLRVAIAGLGTVGAETVRLLAKRSRIIASHAGRPVMVVAVSANSKNKNRGLDLTGIDWTDDPLTLAIRDDVDVVCELIGGSDGVAKNLVEAAMASGKSVVTANKAMLAHHGTELASKAENAGVVLAYEAAVAGGIPIVRTIRDGLVINELSRVYGILNGTSNYILTAMHETGRDFNEVLAEAQELGYTEADPSCDVDGIDAAYKLSLLSALAFGHTVDFKAVHIEGIRSISAVDIAYAKKFGYRIKLLGFAEKTNDGIRQRVHPCMVPKDTLIAKVEGVFNAVIADADSAGTTLHYGRGAGADPTASAVISDIVDIALGRGAPVFGLPVDKLFANQKTRQELVRCRYYVRIALIDRPGVLAHVRTVMRNQDVSMDLFIHNDHNQHEKMLLAFIIHEAEENSLRKAMDEIINLNDDEDLTVIIRIVDL
ncbi:homoserine dehydrogenase family protein [Candidatus Endolissoclinum faulkneri L2]|uniref:Homoserine dehydrogenase n=1 Tax=Candidatus Endolissoclinum faulkneri L2 TaxID=1193729 RepID=K7YSF5_9PROT|nr:homoserine dehydrogenase [Candidatus Endolissoclinum faulkneri]AFX99439.1 homoserine dehydrogenase family protein [Candidatus Endolissoclinum faulkneri L2]